jgi:hypothetical protein
MEGVRVRMRGTMGFFLFVILLGGILLMGAVKNNPEMCGSAIRMCLMLP